MAELGDQQAFYEQIGFSQRIGFGQRPAVLVIDMYYGVTDPESPMHIAMDSEMKQIQRVITAARTAHVPVIYTTVAYHANFMDGGTFVEKIPLLRSMRAGSRLTQLDERLTPRDDELVLTKQYPSAFYGTPLQAVLTGLGVDTTILTGNSTSGCIRATAIDAVSGNFRVIVPRDCVADRVLLSHKVNLFDIDAKYGDVVDTDAVLDYLMQFAK